MSQTLMECSVETIINIFHQYSTRLGHPDRLNQREFSQLVKKELPNFLKKEKRNEALIKDILEDLDTSGDKDLSFEEFITLVGRLTEASHEEMHKNTPKGHGHTHGPGFGVSGRNPCKTQGGNQGGGHGHSHDGHGHSHDGHGHSHDGHGHSH
ncbi:protein S100-A9 [Myotis daubentonii]|uniref:protein S100-A9 n=1 Tax=Myotis daubentonii TaxID=98922 RepID=UPI002872F231|nr:protein S100-A9 [Myotis daubentonii]